MHTSLEKHPLTQAQYDNLIRLIETLRSGHYIQTVGALHRPSPPVDHPAGYCCLGVACDISGLGHWDKPDYDDDGPLLFLEYVTPLYRNGHLLPLDVQNYFGFPTSFGLVFSPPERGHSTLAAANDNGWTFLQIADRISRWRTEECTILQP